MSDVWQTIRSDWARNPCNPKGRLILIAFRLLQPLARTWFHRRWIYWISSPLLAAYTVGVEWILGIELPLLTQVGPGLTLYHGQGLVINVMTRIGRNCTLRHNTTIGNKVREDGTFTPSPVIGNDVEVGANVVIIGEVTIGDDAVIGAGSVVVHDVPQGGVAVGNPARVIRLRQRNEESDCCGTVRHPD